MANAETSLAQHTSHLHTIFSLCNSFLTLLKLNHFRTSLSDQAFLLPTQVLTTMNRFPQEKTFSDKLKSFTWHFFLVPAALSLAVTQGCCTVPVLKPRSYNNFGETNYPGHFNSETN